MQRLETAGGEIAQPCQWICRKHFWNRLAQVWRYKIDRHSRASSENMCLQTVLKNSTCTPLFLVSSCTIRECKIEDTRDHVQCRADLRPFLVVAGVGVHWVFAATADRKYPLVN